jgi:hypothetical protein
MSKCLRCGHVWTPRLKTWKQGAVTYRLKERESKRCASCRSPYWNKMYVRQNENRAPGSIGYQPSLPFNISQIDAGGRVVSIKPKFSQVEVLEMTPKERALIKISPDGKTAVATRLKFDARAKAYPTAYVKLSRSTRHAPNGRKQSVRTRHRRRAGATRVKLKHGKTKGKKCNSK